jgi:hypothetical protein
MGGVEGCPLVTNAGCSTRCMWSIRDTRLNAGINYASCTAAQLLMKINERTFFTGALL